eukprot:6128730-Amphidinium_carterae.1
MFELRWHTCRIISSVAYQLMFSICSQSVQELADRISKMLFDLYLPLATRANDRQTAQSQQKVLHTVLTFFP